MKILRKYAKYPLLQLALGLGMLCVAETAMATSMTFDFTFENDGDWSAASFGTVTVSDDNGPGRVDFLLEANEDELGPAADIHEFGFNLNFSDPIFAYNQAGGLLTLLSAEDGDKTKVSGGISFDYLLDFGGGSSGGSLNPVSFYLTGTDLGLDALEGALLSENNDGKPDAQFMMHVQSTYPLKGTEYEGSETVGGTWDMTPVPEPATMLLFGTGIAGLAGLARSRAGKKV